MSRPRIAVSSCLLREDHTRPIYNGRPLLFAERSMMQWLLAGGALPFLVPPLGLDHDGVTFDELLEPFDALVLQGGVDVAPTSYGEHARRPEWSGDRERDEYEIALVHAAIEANKPVLGICRGHQLLNVALGGTLLQDVETDVVHALQHRNPDLYERNHHDIDFAPSSMLHRVFGVQRATVNSVHHQAIKDLGDGLIVQARSTEDDVIEAVRLPADGPDDPWVVGVQWHPEFQDPADDVLLPTRPLLDALFQAIDDRS